MVNENPGYTATAPVAPVGTRVLQYIIDAVIVVVASGIIGGVLGAAGAMNSDNNLMAFNPISSFTGLLLSAGAFVGVPLLRQGQTIGMMATKIKIIDEGGGPAGAPALLLRWVLLIVDGLVFGLVGVLIMNSRPDHRRLGDIVAKTVVVRAG